MLFRLSMILFCSGIPPLFAAPKPPQKIVVDLPSNPLVREFNALMTEIKGVPASHKPALHSKSFYLAGKIIAQRLIDIAELKNYLADHDQGHLHNAESARVSRKALQLTQSSLHKFIEANVLNLKSWQTFIESRHDLIKPGSAAQFVNELNMDLAIAKGFIDDFWRGFEELHPLIGYHDFESKVSFLLEIKTEVADEMRLRQNCWQYLTGKNGPN